MIRNPWSALKHDEHPPYREESVKIIEMTTELVFELTDLQQLTVHSEGRLNTLMPEFVSS